MDFHAEKPIYRQIVDYAFGHILSGEWQGGAKVPSVRELAALLSVNTHTVLKAYEYLQGRDIVEVRRGMGYYLSADAAERVNAERRREFLGTAAPAFFREMRVLGLTIDQVLEAVKNEK